MKIFLEGHEYKHDIELMARIFFSEQSVEFVESEYEDDNDNDNEDVYIKSILKEESYQLLALTSIHHKGSHKEYKIEKQYSDRLDSLEYTKLCKTILKLSFYHAAKEVSTVQVPWGTLTGIRPTKIIHSLIEQGKSGEQIEKLLSEQYAVSSKKIELALEVARNELKVLNQSSANHIALYIGIPFCPSRCLYCSFVSNAVHKTQKFIEPYLNALVKEIHYTTRIIKDMNWKVESIYIGGGTPTVLESSQLERLLDELCKDIDLGLIKEFTIEAGRPDTITSEKLAVIKKYDVGRISINPQTMNENTLKTIGRFHSPQEIVSSFQMARDLGFTNINMDVIAGLPGECLQMYQNTLERLQKLNPENLTVHTMSIKRASRLNEKKDEYSITQAKTVNDMLDFTQYFMQENGFEPYYMYRQKNILGNLENVGYCKPGYECIYNIQIME
ncbi:MAG: coproporphyrinogen dehydrogenase HemZ, partial [Clostridia bacterium]